MKHDIQSLAAFLTVISLSLHGLKPIWKHIRKPVKKAICWLIDHIIHFLFWAKHILEKDSGDSTDSNNYGVTGGISFS